MRKNAALSYSQRFRLIELFEAGYGREAAADLAGCSRCASRNFQDRWRIHGRLAVVDRSKYSSYSYELKVQAVKRFLAGETKPDIAKDLELSSPKLLERWIRDYRREGEQGLRPKKRGRPKKDPDRPEKPLSEVAQLKKRIAWLEMENEVLKALRDLDPEQP